MLIIVCFSQMNWSLFLCFICFGFDLEHSLPKLQKLSISKLQVFTLYESLRTFQHILLISLLWFSWSISKNSFSVNFFYNWHQEYWDQVLILTYSECTLSRWWRHLCLVIWEANWDIRPLFKLFILHDETTTIVLLVLITLLNSQALHFNELFHSSIRQVLSVTPFYSKLSIFRNVCTDYSCVWLLKNF